MVFCNILDILQQDVYIWSQSYDHYEYGDNPDVDDYLESEGYD